MRIGSLYFKRKAISGLILKVVVGDTNVHRTPNMPVNKKLQIVPFQKMIEGLPAATLDLMIYVLHLECDLGNFIHAISINPL